MTDLHALIHRMADELDHNRQCLLDDRRVTHPLADKARAALAEPEPEGPTDEELLERQAAGLAARPLLEQVAAIGDCISEQTVGQVRALADRAAAWLAENPPGQPVAIEPRGCPTPGACSCVELPALAEPEIEGPKDEEPSPAAQAVLDAAWQSGYEHESIAAAVLRAAADQVITPNRLAALETRRSAEARLLLVWTRDRFHAIAAELEAQQPINP